jgi:hypothetical protein
MNGGNTQPATTEDIFDHVYGEYIHDEIMEGGE